MVPALTIKHQPWLGLLPQPSPSSPRSFSSLWRAVSDCRSGGVSALMRGFCFRWNSAARSSASTPIRLAGGSLASGGQIVFPARFFPVSLLPSASSLRETGGPG
ncbi:hypothetical protein SAY87_030199 [Trapa incisa]|uniref:Uncharacterized protein n=1 Tax=Trapa incisa TaxID=236973 RepID=A0AAN7QJD5_9MYRT|nr:hypothetical protein SAY87_030199 [Trapa incisa]